MGFEPMYDGLKTRRLKPLVERGTNVSHSGQNDDPVHYERH